MTSIDQIIRLKKKRSFLSLAVTDEGEVVVKASPSVPLATIEKFVDNHLSWIEKKKGLMNKRRLESLPKSYIEGEEFMYEGAGYKLRANDDDSISVTDSLNLPKKFFLQAKEILAEWYQEKAMEKILERTRYYSAITNLQYKGIKISHAKRSWGSCGGNGVLHINWKLIMAPPAVLDYVIVHELVHLVERNHAKLFWAKVSKVLPQYEQQERWLKQKGHTLIL